MIKMGKDKTTKRKIDGKRFVLYGTQPTKSMANQLADNLRKQGRRTRVLPYQKSHGIFIEAKRRRRRK